MKTNKPQQCRDASLEPQPRNKKLDDYFEETQRATYGLPPKIKVKDK